MLDLLLISTWTNLHTRPCARTSADSIVPKPHKANKSLRNSALCRIQRKNTTFFYSASEIKLRNLGWL